MPLPRTGKNICAQTKNSICAWASTSRDVGRRSFLMMAVTADDGMIAFLPRQLLFCMSALHRTTPYGACTHAHPLPYIDEYASHDAADVDDVWSITAVALFQLANKM
jgi:hypothetical protein